MTRAKVGGVEVAPWPMSMIRKRSDEVLGCLPIPSTAEAADIPMPVPGPTAPNPTAKAAPNAYMALTINDAATGSTRCSYFVATAM